MQVDLIPNVYTWGQHYIPSESTVHFSGKTPTLNIVQHQHTPILFKKKMKIEKSYTFVFQTKHLSYKSLILEEKLLFPEENSNLERKKKSYISSLF